MFKTPFTMPGRRTLVHAAVCMILGCQIQAAIAQSANFDIPSQPLAPALSQFARQAGLQLVFSPAIAEGKLAPKVAGNLDVNAALGQLLAGSGLRGRVEGGTLTVTGDAAVALAPTNVNAAYDGSGTTEGTGSYTATGPSTTATGLPMTLQETPQMVTVVTSQQMRDQNLRTLDDVADVATGIIYNKVGTDRSYFYSRGMQITDIQLDGMSNNVAESFSTDVMSLNNMAIYDRVEFVRGANGLLEGTGNPSGVINMVRKRPTREFQFSAEAGLGSWANYTEQLDVSGPLNEAKTLRGRAVFYSNDANSFREGQRNNNKLFYLVGEADLSDSTTLTLGASYQKDNHKGYDWSGLPIATDGSFYNLDRSTSLAGPWAHLNRNNYTIFGDLTHRLDNGWSVTAAFNGVQSTADYLASISSRVSNTQYRMSTYNAKYTDKQTAFNLKASGPFTLFGRTHDLIVGASTRKDHLYYPYYAATGTNVIDITNYDFWSIPVPTINYSTNNNYSYDRSETGLYAATRLRPTDRLSVILGTRVSWADYGTQSPTSISRYETGRQVVPYAGVVFEVTRQHSVYFSYTSIYQIQQYYSTAGLLNPVKGKNYEAGVKSSLFGGRLNTSLAVFQADLLNMPTATGQATCGITGTTACYTEGAKVRNRGFEVEASGSPLSGWNLAAGFTLADPTYVEGPNTGKDYNSAIPRRTFKVSTDVALPGGKWHVGGSLQAQSSMYYDGNNFRVRQGGYTLVNLHANYQYNRHWSFQFNVRNLFDKWYYQTIPTGTANLYRGLYYGSPRSFSVLARYEY